MFVVVVVVVVVVVFVVLLRVLRVPRCFVFRVCKRCLGVLFQNLPKMHPPARILNGFITFIYIHFLTCLATKTGREQSRGGTSNP